MGYEINIAIFRNKKEGTNLCHQGMFETLEWKMGIKNPLHFLFITLFRLLLEMGIVIKDYPHENQNLLLLRF